MEHIAEHKKYSGKVRDVYECNEKLALVTTNRLSAFDRIICEVPCKGAVLNLLSAWWFDKTKHIIPNHVKSVPHPQVMIAKKCSAIPIEVVVRGYITGSTDTSLWILYSRGLRNIVGLQLAEDLKKNQQLPCPIITPTTKSDVHDSPITSDDIVSLGLLAKEQWDYISKKALELYMFGSLISKERGLILVDTKYEFGFDSSGAIHLIDEIHTPDSSRFWHASTYEERIAKAMEPENFDKEFIRLWIKERCNPYANEPLPDIPKELIAELCGRYRQIYETLTGNTLACESITTPTEEQIMQWLY